MKLFFVSFAFYFILTPLTAGTLDKTCSEKILPVNKCPSRFVEKCNISKRFLSSNSAQCWKMAMVNKPDAPRCRAGGDCRRERCLQNAIDTKKIEGSIESFFAKCGTPKCLTSVAKIKTRYKEITTKLSQELEKYGKLLEIDPQNIDYEALCKYKADSLAQYETLANEEKISLNERVKELNFLRNCSVQITTFVEFAVRNWNASVREGLIKKTQKDEKEAQVEQTKATTSLGKLRKAPKIIKDLREIFKIGCE